MIANMNDNQLIQVAAEVIALEAAAVKALIDTIDEDFVRACRIIAACKGRVVVTGMGKSGHIAGKIAATLASTGTPAFFVNGILLSGAQPPEAFSKIIDRELAKANRSK